jgi:hypothetical protein
LYSKLPKSGSRIIYIPRKPINIALHLLMPIFSFKKNLANIEMKNGLEKNNALAIARLINVSDMKKKLKAKK